VAGYKEKFTFFSRVLEDLFFLVILGLKYAEYKFLISIKQEEGLIDETLMKSWNNIGWSIVYLELCCLLISVLTTITLIIKQVYTSFKLCLNKRRNLI
jgi:hypothetical protein